MSTTYSDFKRTVRMFFDQGYTTDNGGDSYSFHYYQWDYTLTYTKTAIVVEWGNSTHTSNSIKDSLLTLMYHIAMNSDEIPTSFVSYEELLEEKARLTVELDVIENLDIAFDGGNEGCFASATECANEIRFRLSEIECLLPS